MPQPDPMTPADFKAWRKEMKISQAKAATLLGRGKTTIYYFEKGVQEIPVDTALACAALLAGLSPYKQKPPA